MTDLLSVRPADRARLLDETDEENREHFFATSKCPITAEVDDIMEQLSFVACKENYRQFWEPGQYVCARCRHALYESSAKFDGPCAWPSFRAEAGLAALHLNHVDSYNNYTCQVFEIYCGSCRLFLGHKFEDGQVKGDTHPDARWRHCVLSLSLEFVASPK
eukprot:m.426909 g.426909  ORF g.426909 m.426909 type:complete len:161 (+) comp56694_c0_seq2:182-664(+)